MKLTQAQQDLRQRAIGLSREYKKIEGQLLLAIQEIDRSKFYKKLGFSSLFQYVIGELGLPESVAYAFINVARKASEVPDLAAAVVDQAISVAKASRLAPALTIQNSVRLLAFAMNHSTREVEAEVVKIKPRDPSHDRARLISKDTVEIRLNVSQETFENLKRAAAIVSQNSKENTTLAATLGAVLKQFINRNDPVEKAKRVLEKKNELRTFGVAEKPEAASSAKLSSPAARKRLNAAQKHIVFARDEGRCTFLDATGKRCSNQKWVEVHHLKPVSRGGGNEPSNLVTLCSFHHDLTHQLALPAKGQITWLSPEGRSR